MTVKVVTHDGITIPTLVYSKDPNDIEEYLVSWGAYLRTGETVDSVLWVISPSGFYTIEDQNDTARSMTLNGRAYTEVYSIFLSGGTAGSSATVTCRATINTATGSPVATRIKDKSFVLKCAEM